MVVLVFPLWDGTFVYLVVTKLILCIFSTHTHYRYTVYPIFYVHAFLTYLPVPAGLPSGGWDVVVYVKDVNQPSSSTPFYSVLVSICVFLAHSTVLHSVDFHDDPLLSHSVLLVLFLPYWSIQLYIYIFMKVQP